MILHEQRELRPVAGACLLVNALNVSFDCGERHKKRVGGFLACLSLQKKRGHLALAL